MINKVIFLLLLFTLLLSSLVVAQDICELIGEIKYSQSGGYYLLIAGGKEYALTNLPKQAGQIQEGKYYVMGFPTIDVSDSLYNGPIPFQITKMDFKSPLAGTGENGQSQENETMNITGYIFYYTKGQVPTYVLSVLDQNNKPVFYPILNIPAQPGQITEGLYNVTAVKNPSAQNPSGVGIPVQITRCEPNSSQNANQNQQNQNGEKEYLGRVFFMPLGPPGGTGYYVLQTDNQQYMLINLPQEEGKYQPGQYKVKGMVDPSASNPYNLGTPMQVKGISLITPLPGMDNSMMDPTSLFNVNGDEEEGGDELFNNGGFDVEGGNNNGGMW